ncbi:CidA/LrgA family protein [Nocardioides houyundeii]|uniref:CidA/LrgA family protein n=1 Tax=Nocardioides houyundeii TaxID=2045452 RepID=UPI000C78F201|nr:CidA/LrgA family protein [Nocardioides houyundeii]
MVRGLTVLLACQLAGEALVAGAHLPVPGPVVGMMLLFALLVGQSRRSGTAQAGAGREWTEGVHRAADGLLRHLQLFFVPAGVGVVVYAAALRTDAVPIAVSLVGSWLAGLLTVGWCVSLLARRTDGGPR